MGGNIQLVGQGSPFVIPTPSGGNIESQMTVSGWGGPDVPVCVQSTDVALCSLEIVNVTKADATFCGATDGMITINVSCANNTYTRYSIDNGANYQDSTIFNTLTAGNYFIKIKNDSTNCEISYASNPVVITEPVISLSLNTNPPICSDSTNGSIIITASNGSGTYQYSIDNGFKLVYNGYFCQFRKWHL